MLFKLSHCSFSYHSRLVLDDISLGINAGETVAIVGQSGVGKSTLLNLLAAQHSDNIAYCTQDRQLISGLNCYNNIYLGKLAQFGAIKNLLNMLRPNVQALEEISAIAEQLHIADKLQASVGKLSGGQQQRVAVARAFYQRRPIFLGDEPVANLDSVRAQQVLQAILQRHQTQVIALHDRDLALRYFDRIIGLQQGKIVLDAATADVTQQDLQQLYL
ncbi:MAG: ATP-binding cassette domain-containing protein [Pseudomonadales bacterium]|nr:ATP-binding cassette domain-containing protein [Pseudomonadales bacterium]NRA16994.1 ATP-binding cassette domain-containing protein [Oceanospirillaceae bacterium]